MKLLIIAAVLISATSYGQKKSGPTLEDLPKRDSTFKLPADSVASFSKADLMVVMEYLKTDKTFSYSDVMQVDKAFGYLLQYRNNKLAQKKKK